MSETTRQQDQAPGSVISQVQSIVYDDFHEQIDKLRFIRELGMNVTRGADIGGNVGEIDPPISGLFPILEDVTKAYDKAMAMVDELARKFEEQEGPECQK